MKKSYKFKLWLPILVCFVFLTIMGLSFFYVKETKAQNNISVAIAADDNYTYPTIVSITSLMTNSKDDTCYYVYIMIPGNFEEENKQKILSLQRKYENRCRITLIDMQDRYRNANDKGHITTPAYYRLALSDVLPSEKKVIWLDCDTLIFEDLADLFNIDMNNFYYKGFLDYSVDGLDEFGIEDDHYICSGVMLVNLEKLRQDNMVNKFEKFIEENNDRLVEHDQTVINLLCYKNIGVLPAKYGIFNFANLEKAKEYADILKASERYTKNELQDAFEHPAILHCIWKPWWNNGNAHNQDLWLQYAAKTDYLNEIRKKYDI